MCSDNNLEEKKFLEEEKADVSKKQQVIHLDLAALLEQALDILIKILKSHAGKAEHIFKAALNNPKFIEIEMLMGKLQVLSF